MEDDSPLKKLITVQGVAVELFSIDGGQTWSSNLKQLREREKRIEKDRARERRYAQRIFKRGYLSHL
jgi:hypothetical protein